MYAMFAIPSSIFRVLVFPHEGKRVTIDQLFYTQKSHTYTSDSNVPLIDQSRPTNENLGVGMYTSLMGTFDFPTHINFLGSTSVWKTICTVVDRTGPWVITSQTEPNVPFSKLFRPNSMG